MKNYKAGDIITYTTSRRKRIGVIHKLDRRKPKYKGLQNVYQIKWWEEDSFHTAVDDGLYHKTQADGWLNANENNIKVLGNIYNVIG